MFSSNATQVSAAAGPAYIEDVFSTYLYTGNGATQGVGNNIQLGNGATSSGWIATFGGVSSCDGQSIATDSSGNIYVCGSSGSTGDIQLAKYDTSGALQWQRKLSTVAASVAYSIAVDSSANVYICGNFSSSSFNEIIIAKYNTSGTIQWQRSLGNAASNEIGSSIAVDSSGNVYICGRSDLSGTADIQIAKYNTSGTIQWQRKLGGGATDNGLGIAVDSSGNVYICGHSGASGTYDFQIAKYNTSGTIQWQRKLGGSLTDYGYAIALDSSANIYVCGSSNDSGTTDIQIAKYNTSGVIQWQRKLGSATSNIAFSIAVDSSANVYVCGYTGTSNTDIQIAKYNTSGTIQWQRSIVATGNQIGYSISTDSSGNMYICGSSSASGANYFLLAKLPSDGSGQGVYSIGGYNYSYAASNLTDAVSVLTDSSSTLTDAASTLTSATSSLTDGASSLTSNVTSILEGVGYGGMVWIKSRSAVTDHALYDTTRGATFDLVSNSTAAQTTQATGLTSFTANGFSIGSLAKINTNAATYVSWTFRKQAKFFDVVTYTGNGANRTIAHNLGSVPGCIIVKRTDTTSNWSVYHRSLTSAAYIIELNSGNAQSSAPTWWNSTDPTSSVFSLGTSSSVNANGGTYVAYLFAHDAGGFGASGSDNVISCGSFTTNGSGNATVSLGYEPQWVLLKGNSAGQPWILVDQMRKLTVNSSSNVAELYPNATSAEVNAGGISPNSTGFTANAQLTPSIQYIYIAIRRGPMKTPTSGTSVFGLNARTGTGANATVTGGQTDDAVLIKNRGSAVASLFSSRLTGTGYLVTSSTAAEVAAGTTILQANPWDVMDGVKVGTTSIITNASSNTFINYLFRRAPGFFDQVCYTGTGANRTVSHNLGVAPELWIMKSRSAIGSWTVGSTSLANTERLFLETTGAKNTSATTWNSTYPTSSVFSLGTSLDVNTNGTIYVAYLFATVAGVSKVGSYTGSGTTKQIDCGFTGGARFVLIKRTDSTGDWYVWDSARGIVAGNDPYILLNSTAAEVTGTDYIDTYSAGFEISSTAPAAINANGGSFIFLAIA